MKACITLLLVSLLILCIGCAGTSKAPKYQGLSDQQLYDRALSYFEKKKWEQGREIMRYMIENFYDSQLIMPAKLALADSYFNAKGIENYSVAVQQYEEYLKLYPSSPKADYAQYQIGMCHFKQMPKPGRDQNITIKAINAFKTLIETYPRSPFSQDGQNKMMNAYGYIIEHDFSIAKFYFKKKRYHPTESRLKEIFANYPVEAIPAKAFFYYAATLQKLGLNEISKKYYSLLLEKFPNSEFTLKAKEALATLK